MPVTNGRGWSDATRDKESGLRKVLAQHINIVKAIINKNAWAPQCYYFIDAYAGPGENPEIGCDGSPFIFIHTAEEVGIPAKAWFIDIEPKHTANLRIKLGTKDSYQICTGDNRDLVPRIAAGLPRNAYGLIYADATGLPDFDLLGHVSRIPQLKRFDILIRYSATMIKRTRHVTGRGMRDYLGQIDKKEWIIREVMPEDNWQWTFLLGMNWNGMMPWKSQGFFKVDSEEGKKIFDLCNNTRRQPNGSL